MKKFYRSNKEIEIEFTDKKISKATMIKPVILYSGVVNDRKEYDVTDLFTGLSDSELIDVFSKGRVNSVKDETQNKESKVVMSINLDIEVEIKPYADYSELEKRLVM